MRTLLFMLAATMAAISYAAFAQDAEEGGTLSTIAKPGEEKSTHSTKKEALPWDNALPSPKLLRLDEEGQPKTDNSSNASSITPPGAKPAWLTTVPFGKSSSTVTQPIPKGPQMMQAVPVPGVDSIEVTEPAAPSTAPLEADPSKENPAVPTQETSPMFSTGDVPTPRKIVLRGLNKVTGRSDKIEARPGELVRFGKLDIKAITCQASDPNSPLDYAGLLELNEHVPGQAQPKRLFRGWMYASSPSITALEHPIYDVTMVECVTDTATRAEAKKPAKEEVVKTKEEPDEQDAPTLD